MKKKDNIYLYIEKAITPEVLTKQVIDNESVGIDAAEIEKNLDIIRNNASTLLNELYREGKLIKIKSRPVKFISYNLISDFLSKDKTISFQKELTVAELKDLIKKSQSFNDDSENDPFKTLIGHNNSLLNQIGQAKAAIMYPPNGLHTLITGESGVGKTTFANSMYEYAKTYKIIKNTTFPFISFNCSDYFNNPQLLLSQLFGHSKGAFTGADSDKSGLVEQADGGILFLDEVHRLPPDGQEMLFFLMDNGEYHRLGETGKTRKANVLIIAATTEDPTNVLLITFLRRIPVIINLPSFINKDIGERIEIIESLFYREAVKLKMSIKISPEVLKSLSIYEFKGNIGQLSSEIKLLCAKAFLNHIQNKNNLRVDFQMLKKEIREYIFTKNTMEANVKEFLDIFKEDLVISPSKSSINYSDTFSESIYDKIIKKLDELKNKGLDANEIDININMVIETHFNKVINELNLDNFNIRQLNKIIDKKIIDTSIELIEFASKRLNTKFSNKLIYGFAFHIQSLINRLKEGKEIKNPNLNKIKNNYPKEYDTAALLIRQINNRFNVVAPKDEKGFLAILLANNKNQKESEDKISLIVMCHGDSTASSMANVANSLLNSNNVKAIDMPLDADVREIYNKAVATALAIDKGKGILLLVDMGSLVNFGEQIMNDTGIKVRTISNVSTLLVLDTLRKVIYKNDDLDTIYNAIIKKDSFTQVQTKKAKKKAIITVCVTGQGASMIAKNILINILGDIYNNSTLEIIPLDYVTAENNSSELNKLQDNYDIIASVGSLKPKIDIAHFPISQLLNTKFKDKFIKFLEINLAEPNIHKNDSFKKPIYEISREMLEQYVRYVNPKFAIVFIKKFIEQLDLNYSEDEESILIDLIVHMGCMLDRCIHNDIVIFENMNEFKMKNVEQFNKVRNAVTIFEDAYKIKIVDDEICYIIKVLNK